MPKIANDLTNRLLKAGLFREKQNDRHYLYHGKPSALTHQIQGYLRLRDYLNRRQQIVGKILLTAQKIRENPSQKIKTIEAKGAFWQYCKGLANMPACHTSPCLIVFNQQLPHIFTSHPGLRREIILNFADVMLMPDFINKVDSFVDDSIGSKEAMVQAMHMLIFEKMDYLKALEHYRKVRSDNLNEFLSGFSPITSSHVAIRNNATGKYTNEEVGVMDEDLAELRLIFREYIDSDRTPPNYQALENYKAQLDALK